MATVVELAPGVRKGREIDPRPNHTKGDKMVLVMLSIMETELKVFRVILLRCRVSVLHTGHDIELHKRVSDY